MEDIKTPTIPTEILQSIDAQLQEMSKRQPLQRQRRYSQLDLVKAKYAEIEALVDRGFAIDEIAKCFAAANEPLEAATLRSYLSRIRAADGSGARRRRKAKQRKTASNAAFQGAKPSTRMEKEGLPMPSAEGAGNGRASAKEIREQIGHRGEQSFAANSALEKAKEKLKAIEVEQKAQPLRGSFVVREDTPNL